MIVEFFSKVMVIGVHKRSTATFTKHKKDMSLEVFERKFFTLFLIVIL